MYVHFRILKTGGGLNDGLDRRLNVFGYIDDIIQPCDTRSVIIKALEMAHNKNESNPPKKHGNMPL